MSVGSNRKFINYVRVTNTNVSVRLGAPSLHHKRIRICFLCKNVSFAITVRAGIYFTQHSMFQTDTESQNKLPKLNIPRTEDEKVSSAERRNNLTTKNENLRSLRHLIMDYSERCSLHGVQYIAKQWFSIPRK